MVTVEIPVPAARAEVDVPPIVAQICANARLVLTLAGTQKRYPGSRHWHYRTGPQPGTLEITWWPAQRRLWLKVAGGRTSAAIEDLLPRLQAALTSALSTLPVLVADQPVER